MEENILPRALNELIKVYFYITSSLMHYLSLFSF